MTCIVIGLDTDSERRTSEGIATIVCWVRGQPGARKYLRGLFQREVSLDCRDRFLSFRDHALALLENPSHAMPNSPKSRRTYHNDDGPWVFE